MNCYTFREQLAFSQGQRCGSDIETIMSILPGCEKCVQADVELDKKGVDYIATLRRGAEVLIDVKTRKQGCSRWWNDGPELAIERWSVMPNGLFKTPNERAKAGWTLDEAKVTDMILYTWHPEDCGMAYLLSFQTLRIAAVQNITLWFKMFQNEIQTSESWQSEVVFVPVNVVLESMKRAQEFQLKVPA